MSSCLETAPRQTGSNMADIVVALNPWNTEWSENHNVTLLLNCMEDIGRDEKS